MSHSTDSTASQRDSARSAAAHIIVADLESPAVSEADRHHIDAVLRLRAGEAVSVTDGRGGWLLCRYADLGGLVPAGDVARPARSLPLVAVGFAPVKGDRPEWAVQKLTELGVDRILILRTDRGVVRWDGERVIRHLEKLRVVARQAAMQSRRLWLPEIIVVESMAALAGEPGVALAEPGGDPPGLSFPTLLVGPEGGWSPVEEESARARVELGPGVLRTESAAVAAGVLLTALRAGLVRPSGVPESSPQMGCRDGEKVGVNGDAALGVYVHIPFCNRRCDYCAFATWTDRFHLAAAYVTACRAEVLQARAEGMTTASSVFFGGGTPSLLSPDLLDAILAAVPRHRGAEVTVECNPETVDVAKLRGYRDAGVTRLSFGVQSMAPHVLAALGREHDVPSVQRTVSAAGDAGFADSYSVDLIFGGVGETTADWAATVSAVLALDPPPGHVSAYGLTVEPGTPLAADPARHPDPDDQADKYLVAEDLLGAAGLEWYEISNWARPGSECRHNQLYWARGPYRGIGCSAHSHATSRYGSRRWWNVRTPERYVRLVESGESPEAAGEDLDAATCRIEALQLSLRTRNGVPERALPGWADDPVLASLVAPSQAQMLVLTRRGRLLANEVALRLRP